MDAEGRKDEVKKMWQTYDLQLVSRLLIILMFGSLCNPSERAFFVRDSGGNLGLQFVLIDVGKATPGTSPGNASSVFLSTCVGDHRRSDPKRTAKKLGEGPCPETHVEYGRKGYF